MSTADLPPTEGINAATHDLDTLESRRLVSLLIDQHVQAVDAARAARHTIARCVDAVVERLQRGGSLHYVGAGSSGRLGFLDAAECPPTFGTDPALVRAHIAGGEPALVRAVEGAEDDGEAGAREMRALVRSNDAVIGISASGAAPYVAAALASARELGALTIALANTPNAPIAHAAEIAIVVATGPEALAGSTRLKAGTAQKIVLNAISTAVMVRLGKVYDNLMVDVVATNAKLRRRAVRLVCALAQTDETAAAALLERAGGSVKVAVVMARHEVDAQRARAILGEHGGALRAALAVSP